MNTEKKRDFLITCAYWAVVALGIYLGFEYLLPISVPFLFGIAIGAAVVKLSNVLRCPNRAVRIGLVLVIYGLIGFLVTLLCIRSVSSISGFVRWMPRFYELKVLPLVTLGYNWFADTISRMDPALTNALKMLTDSLLASMKNLISILSTTLLNVVSGLATGIPNLILSILAMIFSTVFLVADYDRILSFAGAHTPAGVKAVLGKIRIYLRDTLFVVIRSYVIIMALTFTELSLLFSFFGIENPLLKAAVIAVLDIMPILGTGAIMIPWAVISLFIGYTKLGWELLLIYAIVTVVRNYVEPKIVGTQLGLHPIITLIAMFLGLRLFGFWGLFGLPVGISFLWKENLRAMPGDHGGTSAGQ